MKECEIYREHGATRDGNDIIFWKCIFRMANGVGKKHAYIFHFHEIKDL